MALTTNTDQPGIGTVGEVRRARWTVFVLCAAALLVIGQLYSVVPLLNVLAVRWSVTPSVAAWLVTVFGLAYAIGMLISGPLSDRFGRRRLATIGVFATAAFTLTVAFSPNFPVALCLRIAQGLAAACFAPAVLAYIPERVTPSRRAFALSALIGSFLAAAIVAPMASQFLNDEWGWNGWFLLTAALLTLNGIVLTLVLDRYSVESNTSLGVAGLLKKLPAMLVESQLRWLYLATLTVMCGFVGITTAMQLVGPAGLDSDPSRLLLLRAATLPVCVAVPLTSRLLGSISAKRRVAVAMASGAVALAALSLNFGLVWVGICLAALTCAVAVTAPALIEAIGVAGARARGVATALYGFAMFAGASVGPLIATQLAHIGFTTIAYALASLMAIGTLCAARGLSSKPTGVNSSR